RTRGTGKNGLEPTAHGGMKKSEARCFSPRRHRWGWIRRILACEHLMRKLLCNRMREIQGDETRDGIRHSSSPGVLGYANPALDSGNSRTRFPVAAKMALHKAGANGGTPGSPIPAGGASLSTI